MKLYQKYNKKLKKLGTSPIIATILLIGLTVFSGAVLYGVTTTYLNQPNPVSLDYTSPTVFKTTASNTYFQNSQIDSFDVPVSNPNYQQMTVNLAGSKVYYTNGTQLTSWSADSNTSSILLNGRESTVVTFSTPVGTIGSQELNVGDQIYVNFSIAKPDGSGSKYIKTSTFTVSQTSFEPNFQFVTTSTSVQSNNEVTFYGNSSTQVTLNITGILWNYGNPASTYQKTMNFYVENDTVFTVLPQYATQTITIPSSSVIGDNGNPTSCTAGLACANVTIQVTKNAVNASSPYYGGILSFTGMNLINFQLNINDPSLKITLSQTTRQTRNFFRNWRHSQNNYCTTWPNWNNYNQISDTVVYSGAPNCVDSKTVTFDVWNLRTYQNNATIEIIGLNTTAFTLYTKTNATRFNRNTYSDEPQYITLPAGPGRTFRWFSNCRFPTAQACNSVSWGIARNPLVDSNGVSTGIESGTYPITIRDIQTGIEETFNLYIEPFIETVHVASMSSSTSTHSFGFGHNKKTYTDLTFTATIENQDGMTLSFVPVHVSYTYPSGNNGKSKTTSFTLYTDRNGQVTYSEFNAKGTYTFSITNLGNTNNNNGRWGRRFSSTTYIYDSTLDSPSPPTLSYTV